MSRYTVRIVGPAGFELALSRNRRVAPEHATHYSSPSAAWRALERFQSVYKGFVGDVQDSRDPEWAVL